ncbi:MAG: type III pantothenate kinase [Pseudomonadales bacterium]|nr:type III pantothenate kinase [Pseudomonadales bacterium]
MAKLLVDMGNTRLKYAISTPQRLGRMQAVAPRSFERAIATALRGAAGKIDEVVAVSVAGVAIARLLSRTARRVSDVPVRFIRSTTAATGLRVGYAEPWRLGADRWVALVGARSLLRQSRAVLVIDVGTAMTVDLLTAAGRHVGGAISPGPDLMLQSLLSQTRGIRARARESQAPRKPSRPLFADNTRAAIEQGVRYAGAGFIERSIGEAKKLIGTRPLVLLTGGGAEQLLPLLSSSLRYVPDLVLRGLAQFAHSADASR